MSTRDCAQCNGTGLDDGSWDGRCFWCEGDGSVQEWDQDDEDWWDEDDGLDEDQEEAR